MLDRGRGFQHANQIVVQIQYQPAAIRRKPEDPAAFPNVRRVGEIWRPVARSVTLIPSMSELGSSPCATSAANSLLSREIAKSRVRASPAIDHADEPAGVAVPDAKFGIIAVGDGVLAVRRVTHLVNRRILTVANGAKPQDEQPAAANRHRDPFSRRWADAAGLPAHADTIPACVRKQNPTVKRPIRVALCVEA